MNIQEVTKCETKVLNVEQLRDYILRAHAMATGRYVQGDTEMRRRIGVLLAKAITRDDVMRGFLGDGDPMADRDLLSGSGILDNPTVQGQVAV